MPILPYLRQDDAMLE